MWESFSRMEHDSLCVPVSRRLAERHCAWLLRRIWFQKGEGDDPVGPRMICRHTPPLPPPPPPPTQCGAGMPPWVGE